MKDTYITTKRSEVMQEKYGSVRSDMDIIDMYWARNEDAIRHTDVKYRQYLIAVGMGILHSTEDSEECLNDTYVGAWNSMPPNRPNVLRAFLGAIMRKISISRHRANTRQKRSLGATFSLTDFEDFLPDSDQPYTGSQVESLGHVISDYLRSITDRQRYIFISRYYYTKSIDQIMAELGCSRSTVNKEIAAIKQGLKEYLAKEGYTV